MQAADTPDRTAVALEIAAAGVFDRTWYLRCNGDVAAACIDPFEHFIDYGMAEDRWPNRYFDPAWYRSNNPDVAAAGANPLLHYLRDGEREQRRPHPLFDPAWYRTVHAIGPDGNALGHFIANRGNAPSQVLFAVPFMWPYRDDLAAGGDPIAHYLDDIEASGQDPFPDVSVVRGSGLIETNYYLVNSADVHAAENDPVSHYCRYGWREHRRPNIYFDPVWYEETNPDLARMQVNPLVHYILVGEPANRRPTAYFDPGWYRAEYDVPPGQTALAHYLANRRTQAVSPTPLFDVQWYMTRFGADLGPGRDPFAHYLQAGLTQDIDPSRGFSAARYRQTHLGRPSRGFTRMLRPEQHHPLVHFLRAEYAAGRG